MSYIKELHYYHTQEEAREKINEIINFLNNNSTDIMSRDEWILLILTELGMGAHLKGHEIALTAIAFIIQDESYLDNIYDNLYGDIALMMDRKLKYVERMLRYAIETTFTKSDARIVYKYFGNTLRHDKMIPSNQHFLATIAKYVKMKINN